MPEGPEVQTVVNTLKKLILNEKIEDIKIIYENIIEYPSVSEFKRRIVGQKINNITRLGKWLVFELDNDYLLSHLRMEGKYFLKKEDAEVLKHEHIIFSLSNGKQLRYHDTRKFGRMHLVSKLEFADYPLIKKLGKDPFDKDFTSEYLKRVFSKKTLPIKTTLLDQELILGIGNIYANEILFATKIHPETKSNLLSIKDCQKIVDSSREILTKAIEKGGTTIKSYTSSEGVTGLFQFELAVHGKKECPKCHQKITKSYINGRGTYYCEKCQAMKRVKVHA